MSEDRDRYKPLSQNSSEQSPTEDKQSITDKLVRRFPRKQINSFWNSTAKKLQNLIPVED